jgi:DNA-binding PadR family transcriptional regulator
MSTTRVEIPNLTRSCNESLLLAALRDGPRHGYQLALDIEQASDGAFRFNHGTLYPILHRLEKDGLIRGAWSDDGPRGKRKSYRLTPRGQRFAEEQRAAWRAFFQSFTAVVEGSGP